MKVGYFGNLFLKGENKELSDKVYFFVSECKIREIKFLVCSGGISNNYHTTLSFVDKLGSECKKEGINFSFIIGNTDLYYPMSEANADKESKFNEILLKYQSNEFYLPNHPIFSRDVRICGFESWYDYSLYRGNPRELKDITKKSLLFLKNKDVKYLTNASDYVAGVDDTFDKRYTSQTLSRMTSRLDAYHQRWGQPQYNVVVQYFMPSKSFLKESYLENYFGTFKGSFQYYEVFKKCNVTDCVIGIPCREDYPHKIGNTRFFNPSNIIQEVEYKV